MARKTHAAARVRQPGGTGKADVLGALVLAGTVTTICPPLLGGNVFATRSALVLLVGAAWLGAYAAGIVRHQREHLPWVAGVACVLAVALASAAFARFPASNLMDGMGMDMGVVYWAALAAIALGAAGVVLDARMRSWIAASYAWVLASALVALYQAATNAPVTAGLVNNNHFGLAMVLMAPLSAGLAVTSRTKAERYAWAAAGAVVAAAVVASGATAATAVLVAEAGALIACAAPLAPARFRRALVVGGAAVAIAVVAAASAVTITGLRGPQGLAWLPARAAVPLTTRGYLWQGAYEAFLDHPVLGNGPDGYQYAAQTHTPAALMSLEHGTSVLDAISADPHSLPLRVLADLGAVGALALALAAAGWAAAVGRIGQPTPQARLLRATFAIGAGGFLLGAMFAPWSAIVGASPAVMIGLAASAARDPERRVRAPRAVVWPAAALVGAVLLWGSASHAVEAAAMARAAAATTPAGQQEAFAEAVGAAPWDSSARYLALAAQGKASAATGTGAAFRDGVAGDGLVNAFAPFIADLVRYSLVEAQLTARTDLTWEERELERAAALAPELPEVAAENIHLAVLTGDHARITAALEKWSALAKPAANYAYYLQTAQDALAK